MASASDALRDDIVSTYCGVVELLSGLLPLSVLLQVSDKKKSDIRIINPPLQTVLM